MCLNKKIIYLSLITALFIITIIPINNFNLITNYIDEEKKQDFQSFIIKTPFSSDSWSVSHIYITNDNWSEYDVPWIQNRTGTWDDPHIIENVTINAGGSGSPILIENSNDYFIIRNCTITNSDNGVNDAGISFNNVQNGTITQNFIESNGNYGIRFFNLNEKVCNITVYNNTIRNNLDYGIYLRGYQNNTIRGNMILNNVGGIYLYWHSGYNEIIGNTIITLTGYDLYFYANSDDNTISENTIRSEDINGIYFFNAGNEVFINNKLYGAGFNLYSATGAYIASMEIYNTTVNDRYVYYYTYETGLGAINFTNAGQIMLIDCDNCIISNNNLSRTSIGLWLSNDCDGNQIFNIEANNGYDGVVIIGGSDQNTLTNITANYNTQYGLYLTNGDNNVITESTFSYNQQDGLYIYSSCDFNYFSYNNIEYSSHFGVNLRTNCFNNTFYMNSIIYNGWGIYLEFNVDYTLVYQNLIESNLNTGIQINTADCNQSLTYYNNFLSNTLHAQDEGTSSMWDNGMWGNYWDDYTGPDMDVDGIGDIPYNITGTANSSDKYPLMDMIDFIDPLITLNFPFNGTKFSYNAPTFNLTIYDLSLDTAWYTINHLSPKYYFPVSNEINLITINQSLWNEFSQGVYIFTFYVNDTSGNLSLLEVSIIKDLTGYKPNFGLPELVTVLILIIIALSVIIIIIGLKRRGRRRKD